MYWVVGCWCGCLGWGADLHIAQRMPLPLTISCSSKSRLVLPFLVLPFWYLLTRGVPDRFQQSSKTVVCVCVCVCVCVLELEWLSFLVTAHPGCSVKNDCCFCVVAGYPSGHIFVLYKNLRDNITFDDLVMSKAERHWWMWPVMVVFRQALIWSLQDSKQHSCLCGRTVHLEHVWIWAIRWRLSFWILH